MCMGVTSSFQFQRFVKEYQVYSFNHLLMFSQKDNPLKHLEAAMDTISLSSMTRRTTLQLHCKQDAVSVQESGKSSVLTCRKDHQRSAMQMSSTVLWRCNILSAHILATDFITCTRNHGIKHRITLKFDDVQCMHLTKFKLTASLMPWQSPRAFLCLAPRPGGQMARDSLS